MLRLSEWEASLRGRFARMTQRERFLVMAFAAMLLITIVWLPLTWASDERERLALAEADLADARAQARRAAPVGTGARQAARLADLESLSLRADSVSIARILIEQRLSEAARQAGVQLTSVTVSEEPEEGATPLLRAEFGAPYAPQTLWPMLDILSRSPEAVFLDAIEVTGDGGTGSPALLSAPGGVPTSGQARVELLFPIAVGPAAASRPSA